jgi:hypothetical protein
VPIWVVRRGVTLLLPALCYGTAVLAYSLWRRQRSLAAGLVVSVCLAAEVLPLRHIRNEAYYAGASRHISALSSLLPSGSRLLFDAQLRGLGIPQTLWANYDLPAYLVAANDLPRLRELVRSFQGAPAFWINDGISRPPSGPGLTSTPVALYEFVITTPLLDVGSAPGASAQWNYTIGIYALQAQQAKASHEESSSGMLSNSTAD